MEVDIDIIIDFIQIVVNLNENEGLVYFLIKRLGFLKNGPKEIESFL